MELVGGAALGAAFGELAKVTISITSVIINSKSSCQEIKEKIGCLKPKIDDVISKLSSDDPELNSFQSLLEDGLHLLNKLEKLGSINLYRKYRYGKKILKLLKNIKDFMITRGIATIMLDVQKLDADVQKLDADVQKVDADLKEMGQHIMDSVNARMTNDADSNSLVLQQMITDEILFGAQVPDLPTFVVGLNNVISDVKRILFQDGVDIVGIKGIGRSGKSTLALALCKDTQVKASFQNNIIFITVSRLPDVKAVLETMWDKLIGRQRPVFQSIEDAHQQLQTHLKLRTLKPTLVVLDDVWSRLNLENLLFEAEGYKTIITTRHNFTVPIKHSSRLYELPMLKGADALSLFCFWAFGEHSIPETEDENLVKEVDLQSSAIRPGKDQQWMKAFKEELLKSVSTTKSRVTVHCGSWFHDLQQANLLPANKVNMVTHGIDDHRLAKKLNNKGELLKIVKTEILKEMEIAAI